MPPLRLGTLIRFGTPFARHVLVHGYGFSPREADRLVALKIRFERGQLEYLSHQEKQLRFVRWLYLHGRISEFHTNERR